MDDLEVKIVSFKTYYKEIKEIRKDVFIIEQKVPEDLEWDGLDPEAKHVLAKNGKEMIGTGRVFSDGHIGRVAVTKDYRGKGIGKKIMNKLIELAKSEGLNEVLVSSQCSAAGFYKKIGFSEYGDIFLEAGIDHIKMRKNI